MKIRVVELKPNPEGSEEYKKHQYYQHITIYEGEADTFQFQAENQNVAVPDFIQQYHDGTIVIIYPYPSNVHCILKDDTVWVYPAITAQALQKLKETRAEEQKAREDNLSAIAISD
jgi:hypothetical protein